MSLGYPSKSRARRAFWRGVASARRTHARNPYRHPRLQTLWERGRARAQLDANLVVPAAFRPRPPVAKARARAADPRQLTLRPRPRPNPWRNS